MNKILCPTCYSLLPDACIDQNYYCNDCGWEGSIAMNAYTVIDIEMSRILSDDDFNCRGNILPMDVVDLAKDIELHGLQFPIAVQPIVDMEEMPTEDYDFRIVAGHRRFHAFKVLGRDTIPAMVKVGLSEVQARLLNLGENLKRKALNILQEAQAIKRLRDLGLNRRQVGESLGVSTSWVQVRFNLLDLPEIIQQEAAAGMLNQYQIKNLFSLPTEEEQFEAVKKIKHARLRGEKGICVAKKPEDDPFKKKRQPKNVVQEMSNYIGQAIGYGLWTRALAWANGEISAAELFFDIQKYANENDIEYQIPINTGEKTDETPLEDSEIPDPVPF